jgi:hypothetical protein
MEPVMNDVKAVESRGKGNIVIGIMLVLTGVAVMLDRAGMLHMRNQWTLWPLIFGGIGLARFLQSVPGAPKQGLLFLTAGAWLLMAEAGWISLAESWPIVIIALGLIVALNGGTRRRWHPRHPPGGPGDPAHFKGLGRPDYPMSPLALLSGDSASERVGIVSVMGRSEHTSRATAFQGADVTNLMGRSELNLRQATLAPGATATVHVFSAMGGVVVRVPPTWTVDTGGVSALGRVSDDRPALAEAEAGAGPEAPPGGQAPRLVLRGLVMFGRLTITP